MKHFYYSMLQNSIEFVLEKKTNSRSTQQIDINGKVPMVDANTGMYRGKQRVLT